MKFTYTTSGVCSRSIDIEVENAIVKNVSFLGGCNGNLKGIGELVKGMSVDDIIAKLENISVFENIEEYQKPNYKFIGIVFNTYIIIEIEKEMYILDQHAAHERILYEKVKKNYYSDEHKDSQLLLLPDIITLSHKEMEIAKENKAMFEKAGFTLEEFGDNTIKLTGVPEMCIDLETRELFLETLDETVAFPPPSTPTYPRAI